MGGYMQFNYDDIEEFIFSIYKARVEIKTTMECLPARKYHTQLNELFRTLHSLKAKSFYYEFDEISSVIEKSEDILSFLLNHDCTIDDEVINWFDLMYRQLGIWLNELNDDYTPKKGLSFYIPDLDKPPSVVVVGYDINLITSHRIIILLSDNEKRKILEKILSFSFKLISTTSSLSKVSKILKESSEPRILIADIKLHDGLLTDLHNEGLLDVSTNIIILSDFKTSEELNKIKTLLKTENVFDISSTKMSDIKSIAIKSVLPSDEDRIFIPLKSTKLPLESLANSMNNLPKLILQIKKACFDQNTPYSEIIKLIEQDDDISTSIIDRINSSYCNLGYKISDIKQAAVLLGKKKLYAAIMNSISTKIIPDVDLSMYDIDYKDIICINSLRNHLIEAWSKELKISMDNIETMITISILSSLGTILTAKALDYNLQYTKFKIMKDDLTIYDVEKKLLDYNSYDVCNRLFELWDFPNDFLNITKKLPIDNIQTNKKIDSVELYAFILTIVHKIFRIDGKVAIDRNILNTVKQFGLNQNLLLLAYKKTFGDSKYNGHFSMFFEE